MRNLLTLRHTLCYHCSMPAHIDLSGRIFRGIEVLRELGFNGRHECVYECRCHCGNIYLSTSGALRRPEIKGCGCGALALKHGKVGTSEYGIWNAMKSRCLNKNNQAYPSYGGRGIVVCERWMDFKAFFAEMGARPSKHHSLDRINNDGPYTKENCRWATKREQASNRRNTRHPKICPQCRKKFAYSTKKQICCSIKCRWELLKAR